MPARTSWWKLCGERRSTARTRVRARRFPMCRGIGECAARVVALTIPHGADGHAVRRHRAVPRVGDDVLSEPGRGRTGGDGMILEGQSASQRARRPGDGEGIMLKIQIELDGNLEKQFRKIVARDYEGDIHKAILELIREKVRSTSSKRLSTRRLKEHPFRGLWKDREEMKDSIAWVRRQREKWSERTSR